MKLSIKHKSCFLFIVISCPFSASAKNESKDKNFDAVLGAFEKDLKESKSSMVVRDDNKPQQEAITVVGQSGDEVELRTLSETLLALERQTDAISSDLAAIEYELQNEQKRTGLVTITLDQSKLESSTVLGKFTARLNGKMIYSFDPILENYNPQGIRFLEAPLSAGNYSLEIEYVLKQIGVQKASTETAQKSFEINVKEPSEKIQYKLLIGDQGKKAPELRRL